MGSKERKRQGKKMEEYNLEVLGIGQISPDEVKE